MCGSVTQRKSSLLPLFAGARPSLAVLSDPQRGLSLDGALLLGLLPRVLDGDLALGRVAVHELVHLGVDPGLGQAALDVAEALMVKDAVDAPRVDQRRRALLAHPLHLRPRHAAKVVVLQLHAPVEHTLQCGAKVHSERGLSSTRRSVLLNGRGRRRGGVALCNPVPHTPAAPSQSSDLLFPQVFHHELRRAPLCADARTAAGCAAAGGAQAARPGNGGARGDDGARDEAAVQTAYRRRGRRGARAGSGARYKAAGRIQVQVCADQHGAQGGARGARRTGGAQGVV